MLTNPVYGGVVLVVIILCRCVAASAVENKTSNFDINAIVRAEMSIDDLCSKCDKNNDLRILKIRLERARMIFEAGTKALNSIRQNSLTEILGDEVLPKDIAVEHTRTSESLIAPPEQLYWACKDIFAKEFKTGNLPSHATTQAINTYNEAMEQMISEICNLVGCVDLSSASSNEICHGLVLPLLYYDEKNTFWNNMDTHFQKTSDASLSLMGDFCLLRVDRPKTAQAIAKYRATRACKEFAFWEWVEDTVNKCANNQRPDVAEIVLRSAIDSTSDVNAIFELELKIAETYGKCGDSNKAEVVSKGVAQKCHGNTESGGKAWSAYYMYLANQGKADEILSHIDEHLKLTPAGQYVAKLLYIKWWALRKTNKSDVAAQIGKELVENYPNDPSVAPVMLSQATDELSKQNYDVCRRLLNDIVTRFSQSKSASQARSILAKLANF